MFWKAVVIASSCYQLKGLFLWQPEINLFVPLFLFLEEDQRTGSSIRTSDLPGTWDLDGRSAARLNWFVITHRITRVYTVAVSQYNVVLEQWCFVLLKDNSTVGLMGS